ncbi:MAG: MBL fold metallo-hydrolase [Ruminococcaceae bacterium]|nr:MBL fold metallo-hydrolase [Oscillospiraceae bacterium]
MKIKFLGTAAAEGIPALFCDCAVCQNARKVGGKEIKTRSQAIVDDKILIDFPADTYMHALYGGLDLVSVRHCIITHGHMDHLYERDFWCRNPGIGNGSVDGTVMDVYMTEATRNIASAYYEKQVDKDRVRLNTIKAYEPFEIEDYRIIPLRAYHDPSTEPVFYIIEHGEKTMLYANDTGYFFDEVWEYLSKYERQFDFVSLDCTGMMLENYRHGHMGLTVDAEVVEKLREIGRCDDNTVVYVNHFSHNGKATHEELVGHAAKYGFGVTYDGCEVEF